MTDYTLPPLPPPDTHCWDEDTKRDVWSWSADQMTEYAEAARAPDDEMVERLAVWLRGNARFMFFSNGDPDTAAWHREYARDILAAAFAARPEVPHG